jgi:DNA-binding transcriptional LysR family regulator
MTIGRDLEIRHLAALDAVASTGTFGRAADQLGYTQSAVSQQIAALERVVGARVFDRPGGPRPVELTPLGRLLLDHARDVLERIDAIGTDVERFRAGALGRIDIGTFQSVSTAVLPAVLGRLRSDFPDVDARLLESDDHELLTRRLVDGQLDVAFTIHDVPAEIETRELFVDPFVVVALPEDADADTMPISRLVGAPLIGEQAGACQAMLERGLRGAGVDPSYVFRTNDNSAVVAMVRAGMGMAVVPLLAVDLHDTRVAVRPLDPPIPPRHISLAWHRHRTRAPATDHFIELAWELTADLRQRELAARH